jgi:hypothetical protein
LPQPAPGGATSFPGVIEGWTERHQADGQRDMILWLSHREESVSLPTWADEPAGATWAQLPTGLRWKDDL